MLEHDEERTLAEIEANLRLEAPELQRILEAEIEELEELLATGSAQSHDGRARAWLKAGLAFSLAFVTIALTTLTLGPDLGGLVGAIGLTVAIAYGYQALRGGRCPGRRR